MKIIQIAVIPAYPKLWPPSILGLDEEGNLYKSEVDGKEWKLVIAISQEQKEEKLNQI